MLVLLFLTVNFSYLMAYCLRVCLLSLEGPFPWMQRAPGDARAPLAVAQAAFYAQVVQVGEQGLWFGSLDLGLAAAVLLCLALGLYLAHRGMGSIGRLSEGVSLAIVALTLLMLGRCVMLEKSEVGYSYFFLRGFWKILSFECWADAASQAILLSGSSCAFFLNYSALKSSKNVLVHPIKLFLSGAMLLGTACSLVVAGYLGGHASLLGQEVDQLEALKDPSLPLQVYCLVLSGLPLPNLFVALHFACLTLIGAIITVGARHQACYSELLRSFFEDNFRKVSWSEKRHALRGWIAGAVFVVGLPLSLGSGLRLLLVYDQFGCAVPVLAVAGVNLWIVLHRSNVESLFTQLCYSTGEAMPSSVVALAKEKALATLGAVSAVSAVSLLFYKIPDFPVHGTLIGLAILAVTLAPGLFSFLFNLRSRL